MCPVVFFFLNVSLMLIVVQPGLEDNAMNKNSCSRRVYVRK